MTRSEKGSEKGSDKESEVRRVITKVRTSDEGVMSEKEVMRNEKGV